MGNLVAQRTLSADYRATTAVNTNTLGSGVEAGLAAIGDPENAVGISVSQDEIEIWSLKAGERTVNATAKAPEGDLIHLQLTTKDGDKIQFSWSTDGEEWQEMNTNQPVDAGYLPPWDRAVRIGLYAKGAEDESARFEWFKMVSE